MDVAKLNQLTSEVLELNRVENILSDPERLLNSKTYYKGVSMKFDHSNEAYFDLPDYVFSLEDATEHFLSRVKTVKQQKEQEIENMCNRV